MLTQHITTKRLIARLSLSTLLILACVSSALQGLSAVSCTQNHLHVVSQYHDRHAHCHDHHGHSHEHQHAHDNCEHQHDDDMALGDEHHLLPQDDEAQYFDNNTIIAHIAYKDICQKNTHAAKHLARARAPPNFRSLLRQKQHTEILI